MVKTCETCKFSRWYPQTRYFDGKYYDTVNCMTCRNKKSAQWYRQVNNTTTCNEWETTENEKS